ncbi:DUF6768 family protein [Tenacibaculum agarivorans]|uniref:DUF6768 family protein n=1 Tax=Tenacibaculum agarivorans TaxID=1908389 RepID=UPI00094B8255|nr:DUF6768 family protein [Tenacibaculum agarivorans]
MKNFREIDELIKETLSEEEAKFYDELNEQNIFQMMFGIFKGKNRWMTITISIVQLIWFVVFVYCAIQFFNTEETNELIRWGIFGALSIMASSMLKFYTWMQMDKRALLREIKRLELQVSSLSGKISD